MKLRFAAIAAAILLASGAEAMAATREKSSFDVAEKSVEQLQKAMTSGRVTSREITRQYLARINAIDKALQLLPTPSRGSQSAFSV